jgi:hypothetical protein
MFGKRFKIWGGVVDNCVLWFERTKRRVTRFNFMITNLNNVCRFPAKELAFFVKNKLNDPIFA